MTKYKTIKILEATNLRDMLKTAVGHSGARSIRVDIDEESLETECEGKTIVRGEATLSEDCTPRTDITFEVNYGTQKHEIIVFDELEVIINE